MSSYNLRKLSIVLERRARRHWVRVAKWFHRDGVLPDLLIIGAMKSGTTTLFRMLCEHPGFVPPRTKEVQFFNNPHSFRLGSDWYRAFFPSRKRMQKISDHLGYDAVTGEATPSMSIPIYPRNAFALVPEARLIVTLRNPVDRAYSHWQHMRRQFRPEPLDFAAAIEQDLEWARQGLVLTESNHAEMARKLVIRSYVQRGQYAEQLERWFRFFPREQFLILNFDRWVSNPEQAANRIARFVGLPEHAFPERRANVGGYTDPMPEACRERLVEHFRPHNRRLFELLGEDWGWPS